MSLCLCTAPPAQARAGHRPVTPIKHMVALFQENHTFDNYFGTRPGVDGIPAGTCMPVKEGTKRPCVKPFWIGGRAVDSLEHTKEQFYREFDNGKMDGFVQANSDFGRNGSLAMGYYDARDLPYYWNVADNYVLFDHWFSSVRAGSVANHVFAVSARPGVSPRSPNVVPKRGYGDLPTIFDRLEAAGVSWKFYVQNYDPGINYRTIEQTPEDRAAQVFWVPLLGMNRFIDNPRLARHIVDLSQFYRDAQRGTLPAVSYVVPSGDSEHPPGRLQAGERLVRSMVDELARSPEWSSSAFLWTYDDWGGWWDHVPPPRVDRWGYGMRVPTLLVSPYARKDFVDHRTSDFASILRFIEVNWNLPPLASRDRHAYDLMGSFDFKRPPRAPQVLPTTRPRPAGPPPRTLPVYLAYAVGLGLTFALTGFAVLRLRRVGPHPEALGRSRHTPRTEAGR
ncbi:MAG: alkaline phosphatase family protein [Nocardioidaceae bacterium]